MQTAVKTGFMCVNTVQVQTQTPGSSRQQPSEEPSQIQLPTLLKVESAYTLILDNILA